MTARSGFIPFLILVFTALAATSSAEISPRIAITDTGQIIQDQVGTLVPNTASGLQTQLKNRAADGQMVRLVVIQRHVDVGPDIGLERFATALFTQWGLTLRPYSVLVLFEVESNKVVLRLGNGFGNATRQKAQDVLSNTYQPLLDQHKFNQAHHNGMLELIAILKGQSAETPPEQTNMRINLSDTGGSLRDMAGLITPQAAINLRRQFKLRSDQGQEIRLVIIDDYSNFSNEQSFFRFVSALFVDWGFTHKPYSILVVHDVSRNRMLLRLGPGYDYAASHRAKIVFRDGYRPRGTQGQNFISHSIGMDKLLAALPVSVIVTPPVPAFAKEVVISDKPAGNPWVIPLIILAILVIILVAAFLGYLKSSKPRRARAARILSWKRNQKPR